MYQPQEKKNYLNPFIEEFQIIFCMYFIVEKKILAQSFALKKKINKKYCDKFSFKFAAVYSFSL